MFFIATIYKNVSVNKLLKSNSWLLQIYDVECKSLEQLPGVGVYTGWLMILWHAIAVVPKIYRVAAPLLIKILPWRATLSKGMTNHEYVINQTLLNEFVHLLLKLPHRFSIYEACSLQAF